MPFVTLHINTRNRADQLKDCLSYVEKLNCKERVELIVVDNASTDHTKEVVKKFASQASLPVRYIFQGVPGVNLAKNTGWPKAKGRLVAFFDDDCYLKADYIEKLREVFEDPLLGFAGGRILLFDKKAFPITILEGEESVIFKPRTFIPPGLITGANMIYRKEVLEKIQGFDELLGYGSLPTIACGDIDAVSRASDAGYKGGYFPGPTLHHDHRRITTQQVEPLIKQYDIGRGAFFYKNMKYLLHPAPYKKAWWKRVRKNFRKGRLRLLTREIIGMILYAQKRSRDQKASK